VAGYLAKSKAQTALRETCVGSLSDAGSIPAISTKKITLRERGNFLCDEITDLK